MTDSILICYVLGESTESYEIGFMKIRKCELNE